MKLKLIASTLLSICALSSCVTKDEAYFNKHYTGDLLELLPPKTPFYWSDLEASGYKPDFTFDTKEIQYGNSTTPSNRVAVFHKNKCSIPNLNKYTASAWYFDPATLKLQHIYGFTYHGVVGTTIDKNGVERQVRCHEVKR